MRLLPAYNRKKRTFGNCEAGAVRLLHSLIAMKRLIGYTFFWIAIGMIAELFLESVLISSLLILFFLLLGYNLFME